MEIIEMAQKIEKAGGRLYLVGGSLRDRFLQRKNVDEDYCVTGLTAEEFQKLFPEAILRGKAFSVFDSSINSIVHIPRTNISIIIPSAYSPTIK